MNLHKAGFQALKLMEVSEDDYCSDTIWEELMEELGPLEDQKVGLSEFEYLLSDITHIITWLYKFSIVIRNPAPKEHLHRMGPTEASFGFWGRYLEDIDELFRPVDPQNNFRVAKYLIERLDKANTRRRQLLRGNMAHHNEISKNIDYLSSSRGFSRLISSSKPVAPTTRSGSPGAAVRISDLERKLARTAAVFSTTESQTTVPPIQGTGDWWDRDDGQSSETSDASSTNDAMRTCVPPPPGENAAFAGEPFECPYCFDIILIRNQQGWEYVGNYLFLELFLVC